MRPTKPSLVAWLLRTRSNTRTTAKKGTIPATITMGSKEWPAMRRAVLTDSPIGWARRPYVRREPKKTNARIFSLAFALHNGRASFDIREKAVTVDVILPSLFDDCA